MSVNLLRHLPAAKRASACLRFTSRRLYSAQSALQLRPEAEHDQPTTSQLTAKATSEFAESQPRRRKLKVTNTSPSENEPSSSNDSMEPTGVDKYLARLQSEGVEPTLEDLDKCRPPRYPQKFSDAYVEKFNELADTVCRSFSKAQLQKFVKLCGLDRSWKGRAQKKIDFAEAIIEERWRWPSLVEIQKAKRDRTEVLTETFPVTPSQLFLILGKDGVDLLQLSMRYSVHISLIPQPLALRIEGVRGRLRKLEEELKAISKNIVEDTLQLPTRTAIRSDLVQRISRLANSYIENVGDKGLVRICAKDDYSLGSAKRLASRASGEMASASHTPLVSYLPADVPLTSEIPDIVSPYAYALYPFLSPRALPWYMNTAGAFRVRRVGEWLTRSKGEDLEKTGGLVQGQGKLVTVGSKPVDLRDTLFASYASVEGRRRVIKASTGHVLFNTRSKGQHATLTPPLQESHPFTKILKWISEHENNVRSSFISGLPASLVHSPPSEQKFVHRLVYKALSSGGPSVGGLARRKVITFEVLLAQPKQRSEDAEGGSSTLSVEPWCEQGTESQLNLMMPDRAMDICLSGLEAESLSEESQPAELREYTTNLRDFLNGTETGTKQPDPPLTLLVNGEAYILYTSATIRQSVEQLTRAGDESIAPLSVISESRLDLESGQRTTACEITCEDPMSEPRWRKFLTDCDTLSTAGYRAPSSLPLDSAPTTEI